MNEDQRKQLEREFRNEKLKKTLIISVSVIVFVAAAIFVLMGKQA